MTVRRRSDDTEGAPDRPRPLVVNGWKLWVWPEFAERWNALREEVERLRRKRPAEYRGTPAAKLLAAIRDSVLGDIPANPGAERYRQGRTLGATYGHWRRVVLFERFRLFFRYSSQAKIIVYAWLNDQRTLRRRGARTDPYVVFRRMLEGGTPPDDWDALLQASREWTNDESEEAGPSPST